MVLGQLKTEDKSNEIKAIPELLEMIEVSGCIVTIDAMGCQRAIAEAILSQQGEYILALKENQKTLYDDVQLFFSHTRAKNFTGVAHQYYETIEKGHGRIETRRYWSTGQIAWLQEHHQWPGLTSIACVESLREIQGNTSCEQRYYISSLKVDAVQFAEAVRRHWAIENCLHWSLDVTFHEDYCRVRKDNAPENFAVIRHIALNLIRHEKSKGSLQGKRKRAGWNNNYLIKVLNAAGF